MSALKNVLTTVSALRLIPAMLFYSLHGSRKLINRDLVRWKKELAANCNTHLSNGSVLALIYVLTWHKQFRNLFYYRLGSFSHLFQFLCPRVGTLELHVGSIGAGLYIWHGFATIIDADSIGENCTVHQQTTIGWSKGGRPRIGNDVTIYAGVQMSGGITIGDRVVISQGTTVVKSIPADYTVASSRLFAVRIKGEKVDREYL